MKKAHFLVVLIVAALVVPTAFSLSFNDGRMQTDCWIVSDFTQVVESTPLPKLSEPATLGSPNPDPSQTDNSTAPVTSSGAVKASFTVVSGPVSSQGQSGTLSTSSVARDPNGVSAIARAQEVDSLAVGDRPMPSGQLATDAGVQPKSSGLTIGWVLLIAAWSVEIVAVCGLAFLHVRARG